jgi:hypothetical protein
MRAMRRVVTTTGLLMMALLPVAAAVSAEPAPTPVPVAIAQPLGTGGAEILGRRVPVLPESGLLVLVGTGLMGLGAIVRRTTRTP